MSDADDKDSIEFELEGIEDDTPEDEGERRTPSDTREAINAAVLRAERYSKKAAYYSFKSYQIAVKNELRLDAVEKDVANIRRQGFTLPNALATIAFVMAFAALILVGSVITGRIEAPLPQRDTQTIKRR